MTSPDREPAFSRNYVIGQSAKERLELERKILADAFQASFDGGDRDGAALAHKGLCAIIQQQLFSGDGSSGSVIPASIWNRASVAAEAAQAEKDLESSLSETGDLPVLQHADPTIPGIVPVEDAVAAAQELGLTVDAQLPPGGPGSYLDFGDDSESTGHGDEELARLVAESQDISQPQALTPSQLIRLQTFYQVLGVNKLSSIEVIHTAFLRIMRRMLQRLHSTENPVPDIREYRNVLRSICVAHDVLRDPLTRTDYDLRLHGIRNGGNVGESPEGRARLGVRTTLKIGELLECAQVLESAELQAALDMHKAEPGIQFGEFLVSTGFVSQDILDSTLLAQKLINSGKISVAQFQTAMEKLREEGTPFFDTLMVEGWIQPSDIFNNPDLWGAPAAEPEAPARVTTLAEAAHPELEFLQQQDNQVGDGELVLEDPAPQDARESSPPVAVAADTPKNKIEFNDAWSEKDALAETQSIDVSAFRAVIRTEDAAD